eukprot:165551-Prymnesium_polylepis.1
MEGLRLVATRAGGLETNRAEVLWRSGGLVTQGLAARRGRVHRRGVRPAKGWRRGGAILGK